VPRLVVLLGGGGHLEIHDHLEDTSRLGLRGWGE
jgi:hypothetical protein